MFEITRLLIVLIFFGIIQYYFLKRSIKALKNTAILKNTKWVSIVFLAIMQSYPLTIFSYFIYINYIEQVNFRFPGSLFLDIIIIFPFWILFTIMMQACLLYIPVDLVKLLYVKLRKSHSTSENHLADYLILAILLFSILYVPLRVLYDFTNVKIKNTIYIKENLHKDLTDFNLVFISDVQADRYTNDFRLSKYVSEVNKLNPDLVLIGGDIITGSPVYIETSAKYLGKIKSKYGVYSCVGDHDNWAYRDDFERSKYEIKKALLNNNITMIDNGQKTLKHKNAEIGITFVTYTYVEKTNNGFVNALIGKHPISDINILLTHQPKKFILESAVKNKFDLMLAGHTHGGQLSFIFPGMFLSPTLFETSFVKGEFRFESLLFIVNSGLGMSLAPIRYNSVPEITHIVFRKK